jgi:hypothetical protein
MQGDYSRVTFDPRRNFSMVLMQQGRVLLDADYNEQTAILLHYLRQLAADVIGPHGGPASDLGFAISAQGSTTKIIDLSVGRGRYWVDGFLCENDAIVRYSNEQKSTITALGVPLLAYLDVWERHITSVEDPRIREVALGGPDTSARAKVVWQVRFVTIKTGAAGTPQTPLDCFHFEASDQWQSIIANPLNGMLTASTDQGTPPTTPCIAPPDARYRGENQLYRVEIHHSGLAGTATFKWSRENASVILPIESVADTLVTVEHLGRDDRFGLEIGDFVEVVDDDTVFDAPSATPEQLFEVIDIDTTELIVTLNDEPRAGHDDKKHPFLRRWDQQQGTAKGSDLLVAGAVKIDEGKPLDLEDGIQIHFKAANAIYRRGDYWLIPARSTGDIEWPLDKDDKPEPQPPHGVEHHYAPLAIVVALAGGTALAVTDLRHRIEPVAMCCPKLIVKTDMSNPDLPKFTAVVSPPMQGLTFQWTRTGAGAVQGATDAESLTVSLPGTGTVTAKVEITEGFPDGCTNSASATAIKNSAVKDVDDTKETA